MKVKVHQVIELSNKLTNYYQQLNQLKGREFLFTILENINLLNIEIEKINKMIEGSDEYNEYQNKRINICNEFAEKDEDGNPVKIMNNDVEEFKIDREDKDFIEKIQTLQEEYKDSIADYLKKIDKYNNHLNDDVEIDFKQILLDDVPEDITFELLSVINLFVIK